MCEITVTNLHDTVLNEKLWLFLGSFGSKEKHDDGWGVANEKGKMFKCGIPMHWTTNAGKVISPVSSKASMLLGHIRDASARVPVNDQNAHPFQLSNITFAHNGKLTPFDEKNFILDESVPDIDPQTGKQRQDKDGKLLTRVVGRSDSLIFFEEFIKDWEATVNTYTSQDEKFIAVLNKTMSKFYGKFALVFIINGTFYIVRGKTADLYISYFLKSSKKDSQALGWAINTSRITLDSGTILLNNLNLLEGKPALTFSYPELLKQETIYVAEDLDLREIGTVKENAAPIVYSKAVYNQPAWTGGGSNSSSGNFTKLGEIEDDDLIKITRQIYRWMEDYSMSLHDIQILMYMSFGNSMRDVTVDMLQVFYRKVLVKLANKTTKQIRKAIRKSNPGGYVSIYDYGDLAYPWMLNSKSDQKRFIK